MIEMLPVTDAHLRDLVLNLSVESWNGMYGRDPLQILTDSVKVSVHAQAVLVDGVLLFVWGVRELGDGVALGWFITSVFVDEHKKAFWKASKLCVQELRSRYTLITNLIDHRNEQTLRWAKGMGFAVSPLEQQDGRSFHRAELRRPHV